MTRRHNYRTTIVWTGNSGSGTSDYRSYSRNHDIRIEGKQTIGASSDPAFQGNPARVNPEELFLASVSSCQMLWFLHLCADAGIKVLEYEDNATAIMEESESGAGSFTKIVLHPKILVDEPSDVDRTALLHEEANNLCFIANSIRCRVEHLPTCTAVK